MKVKKARALALGLCSVQLLMPLYNASEISLDEINNSEVRTQPVDSASTEKEEVASADVVTSSDLSVEQAVSTEKEEAAPTDVVTFGDSSIEQAVSTEKEEAAPTDVVTFGDSSIEQAVSTELGVSAGSITVANMRSLTKLDVTNKNVTDLSGLEYATNLKRLNLNDNKISDLTPISKLTSLRELYLTNNNISDVSALSNLTLLTILHLDSNNISDVSPLSGMTALETLYLTSNQISDASPLSGMTSLESLQLGSNNISDVSPLSGMLLLKQLYLPDNDITDISPLSSLKSLNELHLNSNQISDISPLAGVTSLTHLDLSSNSISSVNALSGLVSLDVLALVDNQISDVRPLSGLVSLNNLYLSYNNISDISPLETIVSAGESKIVLVDNQTINLEDVNVNTEGEIRYDVTSIDGTKVSVSLGNPTNGINELSGTFDISVREKFYFSGTINQKVTYQQLTGLSVVTSNEHTILTDKQLIALFKVTSQSGSLITVDQSAVDYNTPGDYNVVFSDGLGNNLALKLKVKDVLPTIDITNNTVTIDLGATIKDYVKEFGISATEITKGDLTSSVIINDENVDYNTPGTYQIKLSVTDDEGNTASELVSLVIMQTVEANDVSTFESESDGAKPKVLVEEKTGIENEEVTSEQEQTNLAATGSKIEMTINILLIASVSLLGIKYQSKRI